MGLRLPYRTFSRFSLIYAIPLLLWVMPATLYSQVRLGGDTIAASVLLEIEDDQGDKGLLIPKVSIDDLTTIAPLPAGTEIGTLVFNDSGSNSTGFYYWSGNTTGWALLTDDANDIDIYNSNGTLAGNREVDVQGNIFQISTSAGKSGFIIKRTDDLDTAGIAFRNSGNAYDATIYLTSNSPSGLSFATEGNTGALDNLGETLILDDDGQLILPFYENTNASFEGNPNQYLGVNAAGDLVKNDASISQNNFFTSDGTLTGNRTITTNANKIIFTNTNNDYLSIVPATTTSIDNPFKFETENSFQFIVDNDLGLGINANREIVLGAYGNATFLDNTASNRLLTVSNDGSLNVMDRAQIGSHNIYNIDDVLTNNRRLLTDNNTLIIENDGASNAGDQENALVIRERFANPGSSQGGSLTFEHQSNQASSIVFTSGSNTGSDFGLIRYEDDGSGNGSTGENSLLTIATGNDVAGNFQDDINIDAAGNLGINTSSPDPSSSIHSARGDQGVLVNRVALTNASSAAPIANPANGLLVFNTATDFTPAGYLDDVRPGFYYWDASLARWIPQTVDNRSARFVNSNFTEDLNSGSVEATIYGAEIWNDDPMLYSKGGTSDNDLIIGEDGRYQIIVNIPIRRNDSQNNRSNIDAQLEITRAGVPDILYGALSSSNYIRNSSNHDHSIISLSEIVELQAGDDVSVLLQPEANTSIQVFMRSSGAANFTIRKLK